MPHCFEVELAEKYGILEAILLNYFRFWIQKNQANEVHFHDGRYWTYNSVRAFCDLFPYSSKKMIRNALDHLEREGLLMTGNFNQSPFDQTKWYALTDKGLCELSLKANESCPEGQMRVAPEGKPIPVNNTVSNTFTISHDSDDGQEDHNAKPKETDKPLRKIIPPKREWVADYCKERGNNIPVDEFMDHYESNGWMVGRSKMKDWQASVRTWERNHKGQKNANNDNGVNWSDW